MPYIPETKPGIFEEIYNNIVLRKYTELSITDGNFINGTYISGGAHIWYIRV